MPDQASVRLRTAAVVLLLLVAAVAAAWGLWLGLHPLRPGCGSPWLPSSRMRPDIIGAGGERPVDPCTAPLIRRGVWGLVLTVSAGLPLLAALVVRLTAPGRRR